MKAEDLLLTAKEHYDAYDSGSRLGCTEFDAAAGGEGALCRAQATKVLRHVVALLRERVKAQEHDSGSDYGIDGDDLADELEGLLPGAS